jgi:hypothetical protein
MLFVKIPFIKRFPKLTLVVRHGAVKRCYMKREYHCAVACTTVVGRCRHASSLGGFRRGQMRAAMPRPPEMQTATNGQWTSIKPDVADPPGKEVVCHWPKDRSGLPEKQSASAAASEIPNSAAPKILRVDVFMPCHKPNDEDEP